MGVTLLSNSEMLRCHSADNNKLRVATVHKDVVRRRCSQRDEKWRQQDSQNFPGQEMIVARLACLAMVSLLLGQLDTSDASKLISINMLYNTD